MKTIKMLTTGANARMTWSPGDIRKFEDKEADILIAAGAAIEMSKKKAPIIREAVVERKEKATIKRGKAKK